MITYYLCITLNYVYLVANLYSYDFVSDNLKHIKHLLVLVTINIETSVYFKTNCIVI